MYAAFEVPAARAAATAEAVKRKKLESEKGEESRRRRSRHLIRYLTKKK
jgi:hypothetical protein